MRLASDFEIGLSSSWICSPLTQQPFVANPVDLIAYLGGLFELEVFSMLQHTKFQCLEEFAKRLWIFRQVD